MPNPTIEEISIFCKKKGFVYPSSEIYGGFSGFFDYGHLGVELKNNIKFQWWKYHVHSREDIVGIDGSIITNPKVWEASGHVSSFDDIMISCQKCGQRIRADHLILEKLKINVEGSDTEKINEIIKKNNLKCPNCGSGFEASQKFNLMLKTSIGTKEDKTTLVYLRPETAQIIFTDFKLILDNARLKLPFGIAQIGKSFRNEISPRDFLFRAREFEMMEIEYFINPKDINNCPFISQVENIEITIYSAEMQEKNQKPKKMKIKDALISKIIKSEWHGYWLATEFKWFISLGAKEENFRIRQHLKKEKSHYSLDTWDLEYNFPFGWKELQGIANRTDFDLSQHMKHSKHDLSIFDEKTKKKITPFVIAEPSQGLDRAFLVFMLEAYTFDKERGNIVLKLHPKLAPIKVGVFPLVNKLDSHAKKIYDILKQDFNCISDKSGSIGRRYARADEIGIPYCVTIDFESIKNNDVTIRDRNTTKQIRVKTEELKQTLNKLIENELQFVDF